MAILLPVPESCKCPSENAHRNAELLLISNFMHLMLESAIVKQNFAFTNVILGVCVRACVCVCVCVCV